MYGVYIPTFRRTIPPNLGLLNHTQWRTHSRFPAWQLVAEAATYSTHNKGVWQISIPSPGFESAIPAIKRLPTYALDRSPLGSAQLIYISDPLRTGWSGDRIPVRVRFSVPVQICPGTHPACCTMGPDIFPGGNAAGAWRWIIHPILRQG